MSKMPAPNIIDEGVEGLWRAMWDDLRHNATGDPSGWAIVETWRPRIERAVLIQDKIAPKARAVRQ